MLTENILDDTHPESTQFADCKIKYLLAENKIMSVQLSFVSALIEKYKKIVDILSVGGQGRREGKEEGLGQDGVKQQQVNPEITKILTQTSTLIQNCLQQCQSLSTPKQIFPEDESTITPAFFAQLVLSYEKTIAQLKHSIHQRQILLQELQSTPNHPMKRGAGQGLGVGQAESTAVVKAIQGYDVYPRISERCRKEILELKQKKKQLELATSAKSNFCARKPSTGSSINEFEKTIKKVPQYTTSNAQIGLQDKTQIQIESMSPFEKTILIYKKKKIFNDILESKVLDLKKKIKQKEQCNQILRKRLENEVWDNLENINHFGRNLDEDDPAYLSMLNQSIKANNLDFSVDISRVMAGGAVRNQGPVGNLDNILEEVNNQKQVLVKGTKSL